MWIGGDASVAEPLAATLRQLASIRPDGPVAFLIDDPTLVRTRELEPFSARRELIAPEKTDLPAVLFGQALAASTSEWCGFAWAGCEIDADALPALATIARDTIADIVHGDLPRPLPREVGPPIQRGWLELADLVPMHHALVRTEAVRACGGVAADPLLMRTFWWQLTLRLARRGVIAHAAVPPPASRWTWANYPLTRADEPAREVSERFAVRRDGDRSSFFTDLRGLRITIVAEALDVSHNELVFYGYFKRLAGEGKLTWRAILYERWKAEDAATSDLVILARPRFPEVASILDACKAANVPTLVSIDDNWVAAGREYPRFERLFTPGKPAFEAFMDAVRRASAVLVFNSRVGEDLAADARRIIEIPPNVDFTRFDGVEAIAHPGRVVVAYAGNPRWERMAFRALRTLVESDARCDALIMAHEVPPELAGLPAERLTYVQWQADLDRFYRSLAARAPDIMLAPLDGTRFSASKVSLKYFDAAACGAAGIFSDVAPYADQVRDGETGLLVENTDEAWLAAMRRLVDDGDLRRRIAHAARIDVESRFSTDRLLEQFLAMLMDVVRP